MPTGACGVNCDVCRLNLRGLCSTCGPGHSEIAAGKKAAQIRHLGQPCPILACATTRGLAHCLADCADFPCPTLASGPYPFSQGFLDMQRRRRENQATDYAADGSHFEVPEEYWQTAAARSSLDIVNTTFFEQVSSTCYQFPFLGRQRRIDLAARQILQPDQGGKWGPCQDALLSLATVVYLGRVHQVYPLGRDIVAAHDLKEGHFFQGPHLFRTDPVLQRFGSNPEGFRLRCLQLGGTPMDMADLAYRLQPFPRIPIYLLLWLGDTEFKPRLQILFDRAIEQALPADAIWALVNRVLTAL
jgi:hypothetical protein